MRVLWGTFKKIIIISLFTGHTFLENLTCPAQVAATVGDSISSPQHTKVYLRQQVTAFQIQLIRRESSPRDSSPTLASRGAFLGSFLSILPKTGVLPMGVWEGREWVKSAPARWPSPSMLLKSTCPWTTPAQNTVSRIPYSVPSTYFVDFALLGGAV